MNIFSVLMKLWPAIKDTLFGGLNLSFYLRRNKAIAVLTMALVITFFSFLYIFEQAFMHGSINKSQAIEITRLTSLIEQQCSK